MKFVVIGISDATEPFFPPQVREVIDSASVFSGGKRHHAIVAPLLPEGAEWIDITVPLDAVFNHYRHSFERMSKCLNVSKRDVSKCLNVSKRDVSKCLNVSPLIVVFASGDPLFFGFANTIRRMMPEAELVVWPSFNSLQMLAHRLLMPYHDMRIVSLTGRPWPEFDRALIERAAKIGVLTDREHTPAAIARRMLDYGYTDYQMHVGEHLGHPSQECVTTLSLEEAFQRDFSMPNCLILSSDFNTPKLLDSLDKKGNRVGGVFGIPDSEFALLNGREKMITKMPIRLLTLQALDLPRRHVLWDIGFCTGSVSIEARLLFPHLHIVAFEIRPECEAIIRENARRHGAPGIEVVMGDFLDEPSAPTDGRSVDCDSIAVPDAIFIGGHGGQLKAIMQKALRYLAPGGIIVMNSVKAPRVTTDSHQLWDEACRELGLTQAPPMRIQLDDHHPIEILKCKR